MCIKATNLWLYGCETDKYTDQCLKVRLPQTRGTCVMSYQKFKQKKKDCRKCALHFKRHGTLREDATDWKEKRIRMEVDKLFEDDGSLEKEEEESKAETETSASSREAELKRPWEL